MSAQVEEVCAECGNTEWRWLDCDECRSEGVVCQLRVCVECGATFADEREGE